MKSRLAPPAESPAKRMLLVSPTSPEVRYDVAERIPCVLNNVRVDSLWNKRVVRDDDEDSASRNYGRRGPVGAQDCAVQ